MISDVLTRVEKIHKPSFIFNLPLALGRNGLNSSPFPHTFPHLSGKYGVSFVKFHEYI